MAHITDSFETPSAYADRDPEHRYDCTLRLGSLDSDAPWAMYSYERPANILWNAIAGELYRNGWSDDQIRDWLQSKGPRWSLDGDLGEALEELGRKVAKKLLGQE